MNIFYAQLHGPSDCKKRARPLAHKNSTSRSENDSVDDCSLNSIVNGFSNAIDELRKAVDIQLSKLEEHFNQAIFDFRESINIVEKENNVLKDKCNTLEHIVEWLKIPLPLTTT